MIMLNKAGGILAEFGSDMFLKNKKRLVNDCEEKVVDG